MYCATREDLELELIRKVGQMNDDELVDAYAHVFGLDCVIINDDSFITLDGKEYMIMEDEPVVEGALCVYFKQNPNDDLDRTKIFTAGKESFVPKNNRETVNTSPTTFVYKDECKVVMPIED